MNPWRERRVIGEATLYLGDALELRERFPVDAAVIADPPYGVKLKTAYGNRKGAHPMLQDASRDFAPVIGDDGPFDPTPWLTFPIVILWGANHYCDKLPGKPHWLIWDKREGTGSDDNADVEMAWTNLKGPARMHRQLWRGICRRGEENISGGAWRVHPTQKPVELMRWCIKQAGIPPIVVDPYMGSGSTGVAAMQAGSTFIGVELDEGYFKTACERIENAQRQQRMFV